MAIEAPPPDLPLGAPPAGSSLISVALILVSIVLAIAGQLTLKSGMVEIGRIGRRQVAAPAQTVARVAREPRVWAGLVLYSISAVFWLVVLSRVPLSVAYPFVGLSYLVVVALSRFLFHEHVPALRWLGVLVIAAGVALVGLSYQRLSGA